MPDADFVVFGSGCNELGVLFAGVLSVEVGMGVTALDLADIVIATLQESWLE